MMDRHPEADAEADLYADLASLRHDRHGAALFRGAVAGDLAGLRSAVAELPTARAGIRIADGKKLRPYLEAGCPLTVAATSILGSRGRAVRAVFFDKTPEMNWSLGWHQDRTICVKRKIAVPRYGPWTMKAGMPHVAPPFDLLRRMVTLRVHLDDVPAANAPLLIALGSHDLGPIAVGDVRKTVKRCDRRACLAEAGDVWLYATPILHASNRATTPTRRRALQIDFAGEDLPGGLEWRGVSPPGRDDHMVLRRGNMER